MKDETKKVESKVNNPEVSQQKTKVEEEKVTQIMGNLTLNE